MDSVPRPEFGQDRGLLCARRAAGRHEFNEHGSSSVAVEVEAVVVDVREGEVGSQLANPDHGGGGNRRNRDDDDNQKGRYNSQDGIVSSFVMLDPASPNGTTFSPHPVLPCVRDSIRDSRVCPNRPGNPGILS